MIDFYNKTVSDTDTLQPKWTLVNALNNLYLKSILLIFL